MSQSEPFIVIDNKQDNVPDPKTIVQECRSVRKTQSRVEKAIPGVALVDDSGKTYCWVKYGGAVTMGEARTQDFVWRTLNTNADADSTHPAVRVPRVYLAFQLGYSGYIVMEHIEGETCDTSDSDVALVAAAVEALIAIRSPTPVPGPIGGGTIFHRFFLHWESPVAYDSIAELQDHVNGILAFVGRPLRVDFKPEVAEHGLPLCPCDMNPKNFIKDRSGQIVAIVWHIYGTYIVQKVLHKIYTGSELISAQVESFSHKFNPSFKYFAQVLRRRDLTHVAYMASYISARVHHRLLVAVFIPSLRQFAAWKALGAKP